MFLYFESIIFYFLEKKISMPSDLQSLYNLYQQEIHAITLQNKDFNNTIDQINFPDVERLNNCNYYTY